MKHLIYIALFLCGSIFAQEKGLFEQATTAYSEENYQAAIEKYEQILSNGRTSVSVYYNLANAHYKLGHVAPSIYYYEKALQLQPNDEDVKNNLAFAQKMTVDAIEPAPKNKISKLIDNTIAIFDYNEWAWITVIFSVFFAALILGYYFAISPQRKRLFFIPAIGSFALGIVAVIFANLRYTSQQNNQFAIIFAQEAKVKAEPSQRSNEVFLLHEGTKVKIKETFGNWYEIKLADGKQGWIAEGEVKKLWFTWHKKFS